MKLLFIFIIPFVFLFGANRDFNLYKKEGNTKGNTLLIIGGIHGDEPGGYFCSCIFRKIL